jgi:hypothetical protein
MKSGEASSKRQIQNTSSANALCCLLCNSTVDIIVRLTELTGKFGYAQYKLGHRIVQNGRF